MTTLAERIEEIMLAMGWKIPQVAETCGCSYQAVKKWLTGATMRIDGEHLVRLSKKSGYEAEWILFGTGPKHRMYAKNELQAGALCVMDHVSETEQYKIRAVVDAIGGVKMKQ